MTITGPVAGGKITTTWTDAVTDDANSRGVVGNVSTATNGTASSGTTETRDAVLGNLQVTLDTTRQYRVRATGLVNAGTAGHRAHVTIRRVVGTGTPTTSDTLTGEWQGYVVAVGSGGRISYLVDDLFTAASNGVHTFALFCQDQDSGAMTPVSLSLTRRMYVEDMGASS